MVKGRLGVLLLVWLALCADRGIANALSHQMTPARARKVFGEVSAKPRLDANVAIQTLLLALTSFIAFRIHRFCHGVLAEDRREDEQRNQNMHRLSLQPVTAPELSLDSLAIDAYQSWKNKQASDTEKRLWNKALPVQNDESIVTLLQTHASTDLHEDSEESQPALDLGGEVQDTEEEEAMLDKLGRGYDLPGSRTRISFCTALRHWAIPEFRWVIPTFMAVRLALLVYAVIGHTTFQPP